MLTIIIIITTITIIVIIVIIVIISIIIMFVIISIIVAPSRARGTSSGTGRRGSARGACPR